MTKRKRVTVPHRDLHSPQLASEFTGHLQGNLGGDAHQHSLFIQRLSKHTLAGDWAVGEQIFFNGIVIAILIRRQNTHYLKVKKKKKTEEKKVHLLMFRGSFRKTRIYGCKHLLPLSSQEANINIPTVLLFFIIFFVWPRHTACSISVP